MNIAFKTLSAAMLLLGSANVFAASSVDLTVKGLIVPSACTPTLSNGGAVDYGKISAKDLNADTPYSLPRQSVQIQVTCEAATLMALETKDNREGSAYEENDTMLFGLGLINGTEKLGGMELRLQSVLANGNSADLIGSTNNGQTWIRWSNLQTNMINSVATPGTLIPIPVQLLTADLEVSSAIAPSNGLTLTNEVAIDGSVTISVRYM